MKNYIKNPILLMFLSVALLVGCNENPDDSKERAEQANEDRFEDSDMKDDAEFAVHAADGGLFEVRASELAQTKATDPNVKDIARKMIQDHTTANNQLKDIASRKDIQLPTAISEDKQDKYEDLAEVAGDDFDKKYVDEMIDSHEEMIEKFRDHAEEANDPEIQDWVAQQIPTLEQHLNHLKQHRDENNGNNMNEMDGTQRTTEDGMDGYDDNTRGAQNTGVDRNSTTMQDRGNNTDDRTADDAPRQND